MTDSSYAPPSRDAADETSLGGVLRTMARKLVQNVDDCIPAVVTATDGRLWATVQPQIMMLTTTGERIARAPIPRVPIFTPGAGGFVVSFPVKAGDFGWLKATDRDLSLFLQSLQSDVPNTRRQHSFSDGYFIPDVLRQWTLNGDDAARLVIQSADGSAVIAIGADKIKVKHGTLVEIDAPTVTTSSDLTVGGKLTTTGDADIGGKAVVTGSISSGGTVLAVP